LDTLVAVVRRLARAEPLTIAERLRGIFRADRGHLHHRALARGWSARKTVVLLSLASMVLGLWGLLVTFSVAPRIGGVVALIVLLALLLLYGINAPPAPQDPVE
jgi:UDP-GlcNAc:undecaprenyl-phosphate GlcNAc-1-phosphate transferase